MHKIREVIVVEGRYDKNALSQVVDAVILETAGFGIFKDGAINTLASLPILPVLRLSVFFRLF